MSELGQRLISIVREKAAENPDYVYNPPTAPRQCFYVENGKPSCLLGHALFHAGVITLDLSNATNTAPLYELANAIDLDLDGDEEDWLQTVQNRQDTSWSWSEAVKEADIHA